ncbi:hypothetical protein ACFX19_003924 [Malus domestica]
MCSVNLLACLSLSSDQRVPLGVPKLCSSQESPGGRAHSSPGRMASVEGICRTSAFFSGSLGKPLSGRSWSGKTHFGQGSSGSSEREGQS